VRGPAKPLHASVRADLVMLVYRLLAWHARMCDIRQCGNASLVRSDNDFIDCLDRVLPLLRGSLLVFSRPRLIWPHYVQVLNRLLRAQSLLLRDSKDKKVCFFHV
jgi:hypothetical protein